MTTQRYISFMRKSLSARGCLFLFVRSHQHLEYYLDLGDVRCAANQNGILNSSASPRGANVIEIHPVAHIQAQRRQ